MDLLGHAIAVKDKHVIPFSGSAVSPVHKRTWRGLGVSPSGPRGHGVGHLSVSGGPPVSPEVRQELSVRTQILASYCRRPGDGNTQVLEQGHGFRHVSLCVHLRRADQQEIVHEES